MKLLYILLFLLFLSILVVVHELGHLCAAKIFKVYCSEFSIGFGPALIHKKRKGGETYFSLRAVPFGGYVSMYGSDAELPDGIEVPPERSLKGISKWKRAIIMAAGIFMNVVLSIILFFISSQFCTQRQAYLNIATVKEDSIAYNAGIKNEDTILFLNMGDDYYKSETRTLYYLDKNGTASFSSLNEENVEQITTREISVCLSPSGLTLSNLNYDSYLRAYVISTSADGTRNYYNVLEDSTLTSIKFNIDTVDYSRKEVDENGNETYPYSISHEIILKKIENKINDKVETKFESLGLSLYLHSYHNSFPTAINQTFKNFGTSSTLIFKSIGNLFVGKGWNDVGGPISIYKATTTTLTENGLGYFLNLWAMISVNLAIFNLLPFPGLDGWHLLVLFIEAVFRKEVPEKAKNIVSLVGMVLLFALMGFVLIKDIIGLF